MEKKSVNIPVLLACLTMAVTFFVHVFVGGPELYVPLRASDLDAVEWSTLSVVWHFTSVQLFVLAGVLLYLSCTQNTAMFCATLATVLGFAALFIGYGIADLNSVWPMPQWIAFIAVSALMIWGAKRR